MVIEMTLSGQCSWVSNHLYIKIESMNINPCVDSQFYVVVRECYGIPNIGSNESLEFIAIWQ